MRGLQRTRRRGSNALLELPEDLQYEGERGEAKGPKGMTAGPGISIDIRMINHNVCEVDPKRALEKPQA